MIEFLLIILTVLVVGAVILLIVLLIRSSNTKLLQFETQLASFEKNQEKTERTLKEEIAQNREEAGNSSKQLREEVSNSLKSFNDLLLNQMTKIATMQKDQLDIFSKQLTTLTQTNEQKLDKMRETVEERLKLLQEDNAKKLDKMRETVDEKLHKTLEDRLSQSFKMVSERLELVHKGLGEMQSLAVGVGDLKKVLSNVKTRGIIGEILLGNILEQILTPEQYGRNVAIKKGNSVEFAIKLPGKDDLGEVVYLPLDSKFPRENYELLVNAYEHGDPSTIEKAAKLLEDDIKKFARDIRDKYIDPPKTTDFGIMFLPIEGLYAEVVRRPALFEVLQSYNIMIAGPTTLSAFLNSLLMGFRTLVIEKRSSEVWKILGAVKTEFERFGVVLKKAQEKIKEADDEIDKLVGVRTKQIQRKLKNVQELPSQESLLYISDETTENGEIEDEGNKQ
ncbi:MAG: DNA recombination protein RmuC [Thermodesulfovibrionia bacterium]|nr:DNA recombination protein RmuC [Thermodesulfovibrionia bacterium]